MLGLVENFLFIYRGGHAMDQLRLPDISNVCERLCGEWYFLPGNHRTALYGGFHSLLDGLHTSAISYMTFYFTGIYRFHGLITVLFLVH